MCHLLVRGWWFSEDEPNDAFSSLKPSTLAKGFDESLSVIKETYTKDGPFDGILGFSQGAAMAAMVLAMSQQGSKTNRKFECHLKCS